MKKNQPKRKGDGDIGCLLIMVLIIIGVFSICSGAVNLAQKTHQESLDKKNTIEGVVSSLESFNVPEPKEPPPEKGKTTISYKPQPYNPERTKINFQDGRSKEFVGIPSKPIEANKYYIITFNGYNQITNIELKEK